MHDPSECNDRSCRELACKLHAWKRPGTMVSPAATPTRRNQRPPRLVGNAWERGTVRDGRGMPLLKTDSNGTLTQVGVKEYSERYRRLHEDAARRRANAPKET